MKKKTILYVSLFLLIFLAASCTRDEIVTNPVTTTQGILVLYEGGMTPGSGDYSFINTVTDSVYNNVYQNSNNNANLGIYPDGMYLYGQSLYVTSQGNYGGPGKMFRINSSDNKLQDTLTFGLNPYDFDLAEGDFWVTNISDSSVTRINGNLNIVVSAIYVGPNPTKIIAGNSNMYVAKASYTSQYSVAIINTFNNTVSKVFLSTPPVSVAYNNGMVFISGYTKKMIYSLDSIANIIDDSISCAAIPNSAIGEIIPGDYGTLYVVALDTASFFSLGKAVYLVDIFTKSVTPIITDPTITDIYGITYNTVKEEIVIADSRSGTAPGQIRTFGKNGTPRKTYQISGYFPRKFAFKN